MPTRHGASLTGLEERDGALVNGVAEPGDQPGQGLLLGEVNRPHLRVGTVGSVLREVAAHFDTTREDIAERLVS